MFVQPTHLYSYSNVFDPFKTIFLLCNFLHFQIRKVNSYQSIIKRFVYLKIRKFLASIVDPDETARNIADDRYSGILQTTGIRVYYIWRVFGYIADDRHQVYCIKYNKNRRKKKSGFYYLISNLNTIKCFKTKTWLDLSTFTISKGTTTY